MNDKPMIDKSKVDKSMNDKLEQHDGLQLSALMDGELAPDQARFLLRRLQHDGELADRWERWQLAGEVLRGRAGVLLPDGFAGRVGEALRMEAVPATPVRRSPGAWRWGGVAALAASVAAVALMLPRPAPDAPDAPVAGEVRIAASAAGQGSAQAGARQSDVVATQVVAPVAVERPPVESPVRSPRVLASNESPRAAASRERSSPPAPSDVPSRTTPAFERITDPATSASSSQFASREAVPQDPFGDMPLVSRPWPRAVLPQFGTGGALATGLPDSGSRAPSFYPFEPRLPVQPEAQAVTPDLQPASPQPEAPPPESTRPQAPF